MLQTESRRAAPASAKALRTRARSWTQEMSFLLELLGLELGGSWAVADYIGLHFGLGPRLEWKLHQGPVPSYVMPVVVVSCSLLGAAITWAKGRITTVATVFG